ncbi:MAG: sensor domain-containing diguanylate cyclase [Anaerovoracaceae bacterium]
MKKRTLYITNTIIAIIIVVGFLFTSQINNHSQAAILHHHVESISTLSAEKVHSDLLSSFSGPLFVSKTMSNDALLIDLLGNGLENTPKGINSLTNYLRHYQKEYKYDTFFLVSSKTKNYYRHTGLHRKISHNTKKDDWYYDFIKSKKSLEVVVDYDQGNSNKITIFINAKVLGNDGELLGVIGTGKTLDRLAPRIAQYEKEYDLKVLLLNKSGDIMIDPLTKKIEKKDYFAGDHQDIKNDVLSNTTSVATNWVPSPGGGHCVSSRYISEFNVFLIVEKDTKAINKIVKNQFANNFGIIILIIIAIISTVFYTVKQHNDIVSKVAFTDNLTQAVSRSFFLDHLSRPRNYLKYNGGYLFVIDVDKFKEINDKNGHIFGDSVLKFVASKAKEHFGDDGLITRWGGDEFVGIMKDPGSDDLFREFIDSLNHDKNDINHPINVSMGIVTVDSKKDIQALIDEADALMYQVKSQKNGGFIFRK